MEWEEVILLKQNYQVKKIIKFILIIIILFIYYLLKMNSLNPFSIFLMLPIGFIFAFQLRDKAIELIDIMVFVILLILIVMFMMPSIDFLGIFKQYIQPSMNILSLILFLLGYYLSYLLTKDCRSIQ